MATTAAVHVFIDIDKNKQLKLEFDVAEVSGLQIKVKAGVAAEDDLARRKGQKLELVTNEQVITVKNGDHFVALPPGSIS